MGRSWISGENKKRRDCLRTPEEAEAHTPGGILAGNDCTLQLYRHMPSLAIPIKWKHQGQVRTKNKIGLHTDWGICTGKVLASSNQVKATVQRSNNARFKIGAGILGERGGAAYDIYGRGSIGETKPILNRPDVHGSHRRICHFPTDRPDWSLGDQWSWVLLSMVYE